MEEKLEKLENKVDKAKSDMDSIYDFAIHSLDVKHRENEKASKRFLIIIVLLILTILLETGAFVYYISNYGVSEVTTEQDGIYNMIDSKNNVISSDIKPEDLKVDD